MLKLFSYLKFPVSEYAKREVYIKMYAIIESCGKQYKVTEGDVVFFEKLDTEEGKR